MTKPIAVTLVSGFLGAGKTTYVLAHLLRGAGTETLVVLNELGDSETEVSLFARAAPQLITGGCICCERSAELRALLREAVGRRRVEHIVIETTGLAQPERILRLLDEDPLLHHQTIRREVVVVVDALALRATLAAHAEAASQLAAADRVVLSKTDLCDQATVADAIALVRHVNPDARLDASATAHAAQLIAPPPPIAAGLSPHIADVQTLTVEITQPLTWQVFGVWLTLLLHAHGGRVLRFKARVDVGTGGPVLLDAVQEVVHPPRHLSDWHGERGSRLTFIARDLDVSRIRASMMAFEQAYSSLAADPATGGRPSP